MLTEAEVLKIEQRLSDPLSMEFPLAHYCKDIALLLTAVRQLQAERNEWHHNYIQATNWRQRIEQERDRLAEGLRKYGQHLEKECGLYEWNGFRWALRSNVDGMHSCTCGLAALQSPREGR